MEFRFNLNDLFPQRIVKINSNLLPTNFRGDRRTALETTTKVAEIINIMGEMSAKAQGLAKPVTTAQKLRMSDQNIFLLCDHDAGKNGAILGLLKVGSKSLYIFDENGDTKMVYAPCVLDFYIHESHQRTGLGKDLFEAMLREENIKPEKMAIDRPSDKLLGFLKKHYDLDRTIPQMNNFVVYDGFFDKADVIELEEGSNGNGNNVSITSSPNTALFGPQFINADQEQVKLQQKTSSSSMSHIQSCPVGRYAAPRPMCSMAQIIHNSSTHGTEEPNSGTSPQHYKETSPEDFTVGGKMADLQITNIENINQEKNIHQATGCELQEIEKDNESGLKTPENFEENIEENLEHQKENLKTPAAANKQHTGLKNMSHNVGLAVTPSNKMEFDQEHPESFGVVKINRPIGKTPVDNTDAESQVSSEGYTDQGYLDLKFYHNRLW